MTELKIKTLLIEYLLRKSSKPVIGVEVPFQYGERRADVISIQNDLISAFEIKSAGDDIKRLHYQIKSYKSFFDFCYVVCEESNLSSVRKIVHREVGLFVISDHRVKQIRKPKQAKAHDKEILASYLPVPKLKQLTKNNILRSKHELCVFAAQNLTKKQLYRASRIEIVKRYEPASLQLKAEVIEKITADDVLTLTKRPPLPLFRISK